MLRCRLLLALLRRCDFSPGARYIDILRHIWRLRCNRCLWLPCLTPWRNALRLVLLPPLRLIISRLHRRGLLCRNRVVSGRLCCLRRQCGRHLDIIRQ